MRKFLKITALMLALPLLGCDLAPQFKRPTPLIPDAPAELVENSEKKLKTQAIELSWMDFFHTPEMKIVIEEALLHNSDLRIAGLNIMAAQEFYRVKGADLWPQIGAGGAYSRSRIPGNSVLGFGGNFASSGRPFIVDRYSANLVDASFEIDLFSRLKNINKAAFEDFVMKVEDFNILHISLIAEVANAYLQWVCDSERAELARQIENIEEKRFNLIKKRFAAGILSKIELEKARNELNLAKNESSSWQKIVGQDKNMLVMLMGAKNGARIKLADLERINFNGILDHEIQSKYLLLRPDIMKAEADLRAKNANIGAARAAFFPEISLTGNYGFASTKFSNLFSSNSRGAWAFGPSVSLPIFAEGRNMANLRAARVEEKIAVENYQKTVRGAFREVFDELVAKKSLQKQMVAMGEALRSQENIYAMNKRKYEIGSRSLIEFLGDEREVLEVKGGAVEVRRGYLMNRVNLFKVFGGGV